jgi:glucose dehydrogenase
VRRAAVALATVAVLSSSISPSHANPAAPRAPGCRSADWPMYGRDLQHTFAVPAGCSGISPRNVASLLPAWFFHTKDSITASPAVSHGRLYVG